MSAIDADRSRTIERSVNRRRPESERGTHKFTVTEVPPMLIAKARRADCDHDNLGSSIVADHRVLPGEDLLVRGHQRGLLSQGRGRYKTIGWIFRNRA